MENNEKLMFSYCSTDIHCVLIDNVRLVHWDNFILWHAQYTLAHAHVRERACIWDRELDVRDYADEMSH